MNNLSHNICIVILNWNGIDDTIECVESLLASSFKAIKIVIVDNGSAENQAERLSKRFPDVKVIANRENLGYSKGNNIGIEYALSQKNCEYIFVLNNDTIVPQDTLSVLYEKISKLSSTLLSPAVLYKDTNKIQNIGGKINRFLGYCRNFGKNKEYEPEREDSTVDYLSGCAIIGHRSIWKELKGFDEDYFAYYEDVDLSLRARANCYKLLVTHHAFLYHKHSKSLGGQPDIKTYLLTRNGIIFARKRLTYKRVFIFSSIVYHLLLGLVRQRSLQAFSPWFNGVRDGLFKVLNKD